MGQLKPVLIPEGIGYDDHKEVGKALLAWRYGLSREHVETLELLARGLSNRQLTNRLKLDERTVKYRVQSVLDQMNVGSRAKAASIAARFGLGVDSENGHETVEESDDK